MNEQKRKGTLSFGWSWHLSYWPIGKNILVCGMEFGLGHQFVVRGRTRVKGWDIGLGSIGHDMRLMQGFRLGHVLAGRVRHLSRAGEA